jgi:hypothetical protein
LRDQQTAVVADDDVFDFSGTMDNKTNLPIQFVGEFAQRPGHFRTDDLMPLHPAAGQPLEEPELVFLQPVNISAHPGDNQFS